MGDEPEIVASGLFTYKGFNLIRSVHQAKHLDTLEKFEIREDDVFSVTYPKSGTTWMQYILCLMYHGDELSRDSSKKAAALVPWIEVVPKDLNQPPSPRTFASHLPASLIPQGLTARGKVVYVARNPKDVAVSFYHFHSVSKYLESKDDFDEFLDEFLQGQVFGSSWFDHIIGWYSHKDEFDILFLTYEEMIKDLRGAVVKMSNFLGKKLDDKNIDLIVEQCSFTSMRGNPTADLMKGFPECFDANKGSMLRKGKVGDWKTMFTVAQSEKFDRIYQEKMKNLPLNFDWGQ